MSVPSTPPVARIVSGGQTGADRAALEVAVSLGLEYGGWVPRGGWAEDLPSPPGVLALFPALRETDSDDPAERTWLNVRDSHATLVVAGPEVTSRGTLETFEAARSLGRPCLVSPDAEAVTSWLSGLGRGLTLNVAGPRESEQPGIGAVARDLLLGVLA